MAVPKQRKSKSKSRKRRLGFFKMKLPNVNLCKSCGNYKRTHCMCDKCGHYGGVDYYNMIKKFKEVNNQLKKR